MLPLPLLAECCALTTVANIEGFKVLQPETASLADVGHQAVF